jgi:arylsulfatase A
MASGAMLPLGADGLFTSRQNPRSAPPSLVLFLSDDLGYGDLHCYGNAINRTPYIDALADHGCRFTDAHSASPICSPARAALLTGRHPYRLGIYYLVERDVHLRRQEISIATLLKSRGYDTCFVGKWHVSRLGATSMGQPSPSDFGFDHWFGTEHNAFEGPQNPRDFMRNGVSVGAVNGWYCDLIVREALHWLEARRDQSRPFFIYACTHEPHTPVAPPDQYSAMYDTPEVKRLEMEMPHGGVPRPDSERPGNGRFYHGTVTQLDDAFGRLLKGIEAVAGENVAVFFTSDNGPEYPVNWIESHGSWEDPLRDRSFGTPGPLRGMKRYTYEGGHRVPLIIRWPGVVNEGTVSDALVNGTDYLPTLCDIAGAHVPADRTIDGASILPVFKGKTVDRRIPACWAFPVDYTFMPSLTMREGDYVLATWFAPKPPAQLWMEYIKTARPDTYELYNLRTDIAQRVNVAAREADRVQRMAARLRELWSSIQAEAPVWKEWDRR